MSQTPLLQNMPVVYIGEGGTHRFANNNDRGVVQSVSRWTARVGFHGGAENISYASLILIPGTRVQVVRGAWFAQHGTVTTKQPTNSPDAVHKSAVMLDNGNVLTMPTEHLVVSNVVINPDDVIARANTFLATAREDLHQEGENGFMTAALTRVIEDYEAGIAAVNGLRLSGRKNGANLRAVNIDDLRAITSIDELADLINRVAETKPLAEVFDTLLAEQHAASRAGIEAFLDNPKR